MKNKKLLVVLLGLVIGFLAWKVYFYFQPSPAEILISANKTEYFQSETLQVKIKNNFRKNICFSVCYPYFLERKNGKWKAYQYVECYHLDSNGNCVEAKKEKNFELTLPEVQIGLHRLAIPICIDCKSGETFREDKRFYSNEFTLKEEKRWSLSAEKYIFLDQHTNIYGETMAGECSEKMIDFPTYFFDSDTKILDGAMDFEINEKLKIIYGSGTSRSGDAGGGAATGLVGIYEIPYLGEDITIKKGESDGALNLIYKGNEIILQPNEEWKDVKTEIFEEEGCKRKDTITDKIMNYGVLDKSNIQSWKD